MPLLETGENRVILASRSPRRIELLKKIIPRFEIRASNIEETNNGMVAPEALVETLACKKAENIARQIPGGIIIGADSVVVLDGRILGKPAHAKESYEILHLLSGRIHQVYTGFSIITMPQHEIISGHEVTRVKFRDLETREIVKYIESGQPLDKAGSYGIQDDAALFVESIDGCYYNVMGLPITRLFLALKTLLEKEEGKN